MENASLGSGPLRKALRLTFTYEGTSLHLDKIQRLEKQVRPTAPLRRKGKEQAESGFWVELQTRNGQPLYRQVLSNPVRLHAEVPDDAGGFTNLLLRQPRGVFFAIVPELDEASQVVVYSSELAPDAKPGPARPIGTFPLRGQEDKQS